MVWRKTAGVWWLAFCFATPVFKSVAQAKVETIDSLALQWQQIEAQRSQIQQQWQQREQILHQQLQLLDSEYLELTRLLDEKGTASSQADAERQRLLQEQSSLENQQAGLLASLNKAKSQLMTMYPQLPPVLQESWQGYVGQSASPSSTPSETLNHMADALKKLHAFNQRVVVHQTVMTLTAENAQKEVQVQQVFLGTAKGWYISSDRQFWGEGLPSPQGWQWRPLQNRDKALSGALADLLSSMAQPANAEWITVPFALPVLSHESPEHSQ